MSKVGDQQLSSARYEHRIWGRHLEVGRRLSALADQESVEEVDDCYLFVGGMRCNAKIRGRKLKVKRLLEMRHGFERWSVDRHRLTNHTTVPFDAWMAEVVWGSNSVDDHRSASAWPLETPTDRWDGRIARVTKYRHRYQLGSMRAEVTDLRIIGQPGLLQTVAIEGPDLGELIKLRGSLGMAKLPNVAAHIAVEDAYWG